MPQFETNSTHVASVTMTNPTIKGLDYVGQLCMGLDKVVKAENSFHLDAGESRVVPFTVTMPDVEGLYLVYVKVFYGGVLLVEVLSEQYITLVRPLANLRGVVTDKNTGAALQGVRVLIDAHITYTDSLGAYEFLGLAPGGYTVLLTKDGYEPETR